MSKAFRNCVASNKSQKPLKIVKHSQVLWSFSVYKGKKINKGLNNNDLKDIFKNFNEKRKKIPDFLNILK